MTLSHLITFETKLGTARAQLTDSLIEHFTIIRPQKTHAPLKSALAREVKKQVQAYLSGKLVRFDLPFQLSGTDFQNEVWKIMLEIPYGKMKSYGQLASDLGRPKAVRAVGTACGANRLPLIIPCHRVMGKNGLGGFSMLGGIKTKSWLLNLEKEKTLLTSAVRFPGSRPWRASTALSIPN